jgi:hypothetical protein
MKSLYFILWYSLCWAFSPFFFSVKPLGPKHLQHKFWTLKPWKWL